MYIKNPAIYFIHTFVPRREQSRLNQIIYYIVPQQILCPLAKSDETECVTTYTRPSLKALMRAEVEPSWLTEACLDDNSGSIAKPRKHKVKAEPTFRQNFTKLDTLLIK
jgi:hypothetical protein